jgi:hypothetical protein
MNDKKELELIQFRSSKKEILMKIAHEKDISLNALINFIINEYLEKEKQ